MSNEKTMQAPEQQRDGFQSKWGFILACIGSAVGMGNIWRFPIMVSQFGGLTFLVPYFIFVVLIGCSGVVGEFALGRSAAAGPIGAFGNCTEKRGKKQVGRILGFIPTLGALALAIGYTVVVGWIFKYTFMSISGGLFKLGTDMGSIGGAFGSIAPECGSLGESLSSVFGGGAQNNVWLVIGLVVSFAIMMLGVAGGIEKANKVMMPALFVLFIGMAIYIATLPGASDGYKYIFTFELSKMFNPRLLIFAFGQAFFSLSVAGNGSVIYGSYLSKDEDLMSSARNVAIFDTIAALMAALVIIPAMAAGGAELSSGGPGLMFVWLVKVFNGMPGGRIVGMVFFICVLFAGVSSIVNLYEAPVATLQDEFHMKRIPACLSVGIFGVLVALCIQGITSQWMDAVSIYICPLGAGLAGVMFFWVYGKENAKAAINEGCKKPVGDWVINLGKWIYVPMAIIALVAGAALGGIG